MAEFTRYRRKQIAELRPWEPGDDLSGVSISAPDREAGSPMAGDMIARNPKNHADQWLVAAQCFADNFEAMEPEVALTDTEVQAIERERDAWKELALVRGEMLTREANESRWRRMIAEREMNALAELRRLGFQP